MNDPELDRMVAEVNRILVANARDLGQEQEVFLRRMGPDRWRVQIKRDGRWVRGRYYEYLSLVALVKAARVARRRVIARHKALPEGSPSRG